MAADREDQAYGDSRQNEDAGATTRLVLDGRTVQVECLCALPRQPCYISRDMILAGAIRNVCGGGIRHEQSVCWLVLAERSSMVLSSCQYATSLILPLQPWTPLEALVIVLVAGLGLRSPDIRYGKT